MGFDSYVRHRIASTTTGEREAYLRVRVSDDVSASGHVAVYLATGTQIVVPVQELLRYRADDGTTQATANESPADEDPPRHPDGSARVAVRSVVVSGTEPGRPHGGRATEEVPTDVSADAPARSATDRVERLRVDVAMLGELVDNGFEVDGEAVLTGGRTWAILGRSTYDGELILAEYDDEDEAAAVLRSLPDR